ncbi:MAG: phosphate signaling complex protein PhoU [Bacteroidia bacterium]|nr:phosphate signaling complex protein PhoU [Bacteroidia bacterium]
MTHLEEEILKTKTETLKMFQIVIEQVENAYKALFTKDVALAMNVKDKEEQVHRMELEIEKQIENVFALFNPVAIDLRFLLAVLRVIYNLERIGDSTKSIAKIIINKKYILDEDIFNNINLNEIYESAFKSVLLAKQSFESEDVKVAYRLIEKNIDLEELCDEAQIKIASYIRNNPDKTDYGLSLLSMLRKIQRMHDQSKNIAREIVFYLEAKILKHQGKI